MIAFKTFKFYPKQSVRCSQSKRCDQRALYRWLGQEVGCGLGCGRWLFLLGVTVSFLVVALNRPSQCFVLDQITCPHIRVATANLRATGRD